MDTAIHYIKTNIKQILGSRIKAIPKVIESKEMFSNNHSDAVLFYHLDNLKESILVKSGRSSSKGLLPHKP